MKMIRIALVMSCLAILSAAARAEIVALQWHISVVTPQMVNSPEGGPTLGSWILRGFVTTSADIVSVDQVQVLMTPGTSLYQNSFGTNTEPPNPLLFPFFPGLAADSWITTPGPTSLSGTDLPGDGTGSYADVTNDGPVVNFQFAQLTFSPNLGLRRFRGRINVAGPAGVESHSFVIPDPEPASGVLASIGLVALASAQRRRRGIAVSMS